jgi:hypothetical protein
LGRTAGEVSASLPSRASAIDGGLFQFVFAPKRLGRGIAKVGPRLGGQPFTKGARSGFVTNSMG